MDAYIVPTTNNTVTSWNTTRPSTELYCYCSLLEAYVVITISIILATTGSILNILVCFAIVSSPTLRKIQNYLIVNLSIGDLTLTAFALPLNAVYTVEETTGSCTYIISQIRGFLLNTSIVVSIATLAAISVERLVVIVWPLKYRVLLTTRRLTVVIATTWIVGCCYGISIATNIHVYSPMVNMVFNMLSLSWTITCYVIIVVSYVLILIKCLRMTYMRTNMAPNYRDRTHRRVAITVVLIITAFTIAWAPFVVFNFFAYDRVSLKIAELLAQSNAVINTLIYFYRTQEFRFELNRVLTSRVISRRTRTVNISLGTPS